MATLNIKDFPATLYRRLQARARTNRRSVAQEVTHLLETAVAAPEFSLMDLRGLGKELWQDTDAAKHVDRERKSWD